MTPEEWIKATCKFAAPMTRKPFEATPQAAPQPAPQAANPYAGMKPPSATPKPFGPVTPPRPYAAPAQPQQEWKPNWGAWGNERTLRDRLLKINPDQNIRGMFEAALRNGLEAAHKFLLQYEGQGRRAAWVWENCRFAIAMPVSKYDLLLQELSSKAHGARLRVKTQPPNAQDFVDIAAEMIGRHGVNFEEFCERMTKEFGLHGLKVAQVAAPTAPAQQAAAPQVVEKPHNLEDIYVRGRQQFTKHMPNEDAIQAARQYTQQAGLPEPKAHGYAKVDPQRHKMIADAYEAMPHNPNDPATQAAYAQLGKEVDAQFAALPVQVEKWTDTSSQPYQNSKEMMQDVMDHKHLFVFDGGDPHALLPREQNFKLRAVHDYFGHAMYGFEFGPRGEENAWIEHSKMFSPTARAALTTETRGQNAWVNYGPNSHLPASQRPFAIQKAGLLPAEFHDHEALH